jgi:uncharacterized coiled-coil protein SlyX
VKRQALFISAIVLTTITPALTAPLGSAVSYQGQLRQNGLAYSGSADLRLTLYDADVGSSAVAGPVTLNSVSVVNGLFTVQVDFGASAFDGDARWMGIEVVTPAGGGAFTLLAPRQPVSAAPYALHALNAPDGHSLDAADGSPADAVFVGAAGTVGINKTNPQSNIQLHVVRGLPSGIVPADGAAIFGDSLSNPAIVGIAGYNGPSLWGSNTANTGVGTGVRGTCYSPSGAALEAQAWHGSGTNYAVKAFTISPNGYAAWFEGGRNYFEGSVGIGTNTPAGDLHVHDDPLPSIRFSNPTTGTAGTFGAEISMLGDEFRLVNKEPANLHLGTSNSFDLTIDSGGSVGIGTTSPALGFKLDVIGDIRCTALTETSSRLLKRNITPLREALQKVMRLRGVSFQWNAGAAEEANQDVGLIAEEVAEVLPELVRCDRQTGRPVGLRYGHLTAVLVEALKDLRAEKDTQISKLRAASDAQQRHADAQRHRIAEQQARIDRQQDQVRDLAERLARLEKQLQR